MSRKRVSNPRRRPRGRAPAWTDKAELSGWPAQDQGFKVHHFAGISLAGGKTDKTCLAHIEYYPKQNKIFLSRLFEKIKTVGEVSADLQLHRLLDQTPGKFETIAFDVPLQLPKCMRCRARCPGYEDCTLSEIKWMWKQYRSLNKKRKPKKLFTPYTERCVEIYLAGYLEETFHLPHALGSNAAPLTARAQFIQRRLKSKAIEVYPKLSVWRVGKALGVGRSHLMFHKHAVSGEESRRLILSRLVEKNLAFLYAEDLRSMIENNQAFEAFIAALTAVLYFRGECEPRPRDFPRDEQWIAFPKENAVIS